MQKVSVSFIYFFFHFNNDVQRRFKIVEVFKDIFVLVAKRLELHPSGCNISFEAHSLVYPTPRHNAINRSPSSSSIFLPGATPALLMAAPESLPLLITQG